MTRTVKLTTTIDRMFQRHLEDAKRTVDRLNKVRATEDGAALIRQSKERNDAGE
jgi:hypothetical protein